MHKSRIVLVYIAAALILALLISLVGCGGGETSSTSTPTSTSTGATPTKTPAATKTPTTKTPTPTPTPTSGNTLADIYAKSGYKGDVKFDMVMTSSGTPSETPQQMTQTMYIKGWASPNSWKWRSDIPASVAGFAMIYIYNYATGTMYTWYPDQNIACSTSLSQGTDTPGQDVEQIVPTYLGTETVDSKLCDKYQYTNQGFTTTTWIWKDKSFPIKEVTTSSHGTATTEYKNIVFASLSDSLFTVPSSVTMQAYPCYPMPTLPAYPFPT